MSLLTLPLSATAAGVYVEALLITESADNVITTGSCTPGSTAIFECVAISRNIGLGSPIPDTGTVTHLRSVFEAGNVSGVPNYVMNGRARAFASFGQLHASTFVQMQGAGGSYASVGGRSMTQLTDRVTINSTVLPIGTPVSVKVLMDVSGHGGGHLSFGINLSNQVVDVANDFGGYALEDYETTFTANVGEEVRVTYGLMAYTRMISTGWAPIDVLNGRNNSADYGNSAYIYMGGVDPALGITLQSDSGFIYAIPSAVPEPAAAWLALLGLPVLACRARRPKPRARA
ncbi:MAG: hypothetical protein EOP39_20425 [Rubrivivax sp.]|nr:MAG: hypothetical protein EOP39_20425 [Rubrivivax sp.]